MKHLVRQLCKKILRILPPKNPYEAWYELVKRADELNAEERKEWDEDDEHGDWLQPKLYKGENKEEKGDEE